MNKYFTNIETLINYILIKEKDIKKAREELEETKKAKEEILKELHIENAKISDILMTEEEREEELKYALIPYGLIIIFLIILYITITSKIFTIKIFITLIPIILSIPISRKIIEKVKIKYQKLREDKKILIEEASKRRKELLEKEQILSKKEENLYNLIREIESDILDKKEYIAKIENAVITYLAPILDRLIEDEITKNNNNYLQEILERIREI